MSRQRMNVVTCISIAIVTQIYIAGFHPFSGSHSGSNNCQQQQPVRPYYPACFSVPSHYSRYVSQRQTPVPSMTDSSQSTLSSSASGSITSSATTPEMSDPVPPPLWILERLDPQSGFSGPSASTTSPQTTSMVDVVDLNRKKIIKSLNCEVTKLGDELFELQRADARQEININAMENFIAACRQYAESPDVPSSSSSSSSSSSRSSNSSLRDDRRNLYQQSRGLLAVVDPEGIVQRQTRSRLGGGQPPATGKRKRATK